MALWEQHGELLVYKSFVSIYPDYAAYYHQIAGCIPPLVEVEVSCAPDEDLSSNPLTDTSQFKARDQSMTSDETNCSPGVNRTEPESSGEEAPGDKSSCGVHSNNELNWARKANAEESGSSLEDGHLNKSTESHARSVLPNSSDSKLEVSHLPCTSAKNDHCYAPASSNDHQYSVDAKSSDHSYNTNMSNNGCPQSGEEINDYSNGNCVHHCVMYSFLGSRQQSA